MCVGGILVLDAARGQSSPLWLHDLWIWSVVPEKQLSTLLNGRGLFRASSAVTCLRLLLHEGRDPCLSPSEMSLGTYFRAQVRESQSGHVHLENGNTSQTHCQGLRTAWPRDIKKSRHDFDQVILSRLI